MIPILRSQNQKKKIDSLLRKIDKVIHVPTRRSATNSKRRTARTFPTRPHDRFETVMCTACVNAKARVEARWQYAKNRDKANIYVHICQLMCV